MHIKFDTLSHFSPCVLMPFLVPIFSNYITFNGTEEQFCIFCLLGITLRRTFECMVRDDYSSKFSALKEGGD